MALSALEIPRTDATSIIEALRASYSTELLAAAVAHFDLFAQLESQPLASAELGRRLGLADRPLAVLLTAMRAMGLLTMDSGQQINLSPLARAHLLPDAPFYIGDYVSLVANSAGVLEMVQRLRTNSPRGVIPKSRDADGELTAGNKGVPASKPGSAAPPPLEGAAFIYREGLESAMEDETAARRLTLALAGRAKNVAPVLAARVPMREAKSLLDVGGGTGIYGIAFLQANPNLRCIVWDRPQVLKVAREMAESHGVTDRLECRSGDMFADPVPAECDVALLSNVLHDWDVPECRTLVGRLAQALPRGGRLLIHDAFLNDALDGPLAVALYSAALFSLTEGRAYSAAEYRLWLLEAGLTPQTVVPTRIHCGVLEGVKG